METLTVERHRKPGTFSPENARAMAMRAIESRQAAKAKAEADAREAEELRAKLAAETPQSGRLAFQLRQIEELMDGESDANTLQKLANAHSKLFAAWQTLTGHPKAPTARGGKPQRQPPVEPIAPIPPTQ